MDNNVEFCLDETRSTSLGARAVDKVTGYQGRMVAACIYYGSQTTRVCLTNYNPDTGTLNERWVDVTDVELV